MLNYTHPSYSFLSAFTTLERDRGACILAWLSIRKIQYTVVSIQGKNHIILTFNKSKSSTAKYKKIFIAHYDRVPGSPGANDNSAACAQLLLFAEQLHAKESISSNITIIFTDGEEAGGKEGITSQGSFAIGTALRLSEYHKTEMYVFDACGRGDTLVISTQGLSLAQTYDHTTTSRKMFNKNLFSLHEKTCAIVMDSQIPNWIRIPTPYSDNAGLIAAGIPAQIITVLPSCEATSLHEALRDTRKAQELLPAIAKNMFSQTLTGVPSTWKLMHTANDTLDTLNDEAFVIIERFLAACILSE